MDLPVQQQQHWAGTTIGLCLKVCLVYRLLPRISPSDSVSMAHCSESPLKKQSIRKLVRNETGAADLLVQRLPRPGVTVNQNVNWCGRKARWFVGKSTEATASIRWKKCTAYLLLCGAGAKRRRERMSAWMDEWGKEKKKKKALMRKHRCTEKSLEEVGSGMSRQSCTLYLAVTLSGGQRPR